MGVEGDPGPAGAIGQQGPSGIAGTKGARGRPGRFGPPGNDVSELHNLSGSFYATALYYREKLAMLVLREQRERKGGKGPW
jgi:hypothetical protein